MIREWLVVGIRDRHLSESLQFDPEFTLQKAKKAIRQREVVQGQQKAISGATGEPSDRLQGNSNQTIFRATGVNKMQTEDLVNLQLNNAHAVAKHHTAEKSVQQMMLYVTDVNERHIFIHAA